MADAIAHRAFLGFRALCCAAACAGLAHIDAFEIHIALRARDAITQRHFDFGFEIESACRTTTAATSSAATTAKDVAEHREDVLDMHRAEVVARLLTKSRVTMAVIQLTTLRVGEDFIRLGTRFEFNFRFSTSRISIGMPLHRHAAIGALDLITVGFTGEAENFVVIALRGQRGALECYQKESRGLWHAMRETRRTPQSSRSNQLS